MSYEQLTRAKLLLEQAEKLLSSYTANVYSSEAEQAYITISNEVLPAVNVAIKYHEENIADNKPVSSFRGRASKIVGGDFEIFTRGGV
jgi:hypothetical protein